MRQNTVNKIALLALPLLLLPLLILSSVAAKAAAEADEILHFSSTSCHSCAGQQELVKQIADERGIEAVFVDVDEDRDTAEQYQVKLVPDLILLRDGQEIGRLDGSITVDDLKNFLADMEGVKPAPATQPQTNQSTEAGNESAAEAESSSKLLLVIGAAAVLLAAGAGLAVNKAKAAKQPKDPNELVKSPADGSLVTRAQAEHEQALLDQGYVYNPQKNGFDYVPKPVEQKTSGPSYISKQIAKDRQNPKKRKGILDDLIKKIRRQRAEAIREDMAAAQRDYKRYVERAETMDTLAKGAQLVEDAADIGVDALAEVTGPAGKAVKRTYDLAKDTVTIADHVATEGTKGFVSGAKEVATGKVRSKALGKIKVPKSKLANKTMRHLQDSATDKIVDKSIGDKLP